MNPLLSEVEAFLATHEMAPSRFGLAAVGDNHLVTDMKDGRRLWPETERKIRLFMATYRADAA